VHLLQKPTGAKRFFTWLLVLQLNVAENQELPETIGESGTFQVSDPGRRTSATKKKQAAYICVQCNSGNPKNKPCQKPP